MRQRTGPLANCLGSVRLRYRTAWARPNRASSRFRVGRESKRSAEAGSDWAAAAETRSERLARLEAVLFLGREPLSTRKLAQLADLADGTEARTLIRQLEGRLDAEHRAFRPVEVAGGFLLMTRPKFAPWLRRLHEVPIEVRLSTPAMETLAVIAYRQPVLRASIESIRGVQCGEIVRQLMERDLVRIVGRSEELGRPFLYGTTKRFLEVFGLRHVDDLPRHDHVPPGVVTGGSQVAAPGGGAALEREDSEPVSQTSEEEKEVKTETIAEFTWEDAPASATKMPLEDEPRGQIDEDEYEFDDEEEWEEVDDEDEDWDEDDDLDETEWVEVEEDDPELEEIDEEEDWEEDDEDWEEDEEGEWEEGDEDEEDDEEEWDDEEDWEEEDEE